MKEIKGIIFDKDGTLFHYGRVWGPIGARILGEGLRIFRSLDDDRRLQLELRIEKILGVDRYSNNYPDGVLYDSRRLPLGILCVIREAFRFRVSPGKLIGVIRDGMDRIPPLLEEALRRYDFSEARNVIRALHEKGYRIGIVTSDNSKSTPIFLRMIGIEDCISFIRTSDSENCRHKPHPDAIDQFCDEFSLKPESVCMVGDTVTDMVFAKRGKCGYRVALLTGQNDEPRLRKNSDAVYDSIGCLVDDRVLFTD